MTWRVIHGWRGLLAAACGAVLVVNGIVTATSGSAATGSGGVTIRAAEFNWTAAALTNAILSDIASAHPELGVSQIVSTPLDPAAAWAGAARGDIDMLTEVALPNQQPLAAKARSQVKLIDETYGQAVQGWFVPAYAVQPGQPLAGLKSITQLNSYSSAVGGRLIDGDPGWVTTQQDVARLKAYHLNLQDTPSGANAELAQLTRSYVQHQPFVIYLYEPLWVFAKYKLVQLQEPHPYKTGCFTGSNNQCAIPTLSAWIGASNKMAKQAPKFYAMLKHVKIPLLQMEQMLQLTDLEKHSVTSVAQQWVNAHQAQVSAWIKA
jgi:glycine betaine/proline transport system substrate-binding protein